MKKLLVLLLLSAPGGALTGCTHTSINWLKVETCPPRRSAEQVQVFYTRKAVPYHYKVVAKYRVSTNSRRYDQVLRKVAAKAAKHGSDAILVEQSYGYSSTVWSWLLMFIPLTEHAKILSVSGIRYLPAGGG